MKLFGLIGHPLTHSFSKKYFTRKFESEQILDCAYELFDLKELNQLSEILNNSPQLRGLNVTIPYKEKMMAYLTEIDSHAQAIGAVNTIKIDPSTNTLKGYNTDYYGFKKSIKPFLESHHERALILGTGGASKTVQYVLKELNIDFLLATRNPQHDNEISYADINKYVLKHHLLLVNTTPVGMQPNTSEFPNLDYTQLTPSHLLYDLIYNPAETQFILKGKQQGCTTLNGMEMLQLQAEKSWEIWNTF